MREAFFKTFTKSAAQTLLIKRAGAALLVFALVLAGCGTDPPTNAGWCYTLDFTTTNYSNLITLGSWVDGEGFVTGDDGQLQFSYSYTTTVQATHATVTIARGVGVTGDINIEANANIFGIQPPAAINNTLPNGIDTVNYGIDPQSPGVIGSAFTIQVRSSLQTRVKSIKLFGNLPNPFPANECDGTPAPTNTAFLVTHTATPIPTATLPPSETSTPSDTPPPSDTPSPTATHLYDWCYRWDASTSFTDWTIRVPSDYGISASPDIWGHFEDGLPRTDARSGAGFSGYYVDEGLNVFRNFSPNITVTSFIMHADVNTGAYDGTPDLEVDFSDGVGGQFSPPTVGSNIEFTGSFGPRTISSVQLYATVAHSAAYTSGAYVHIIDLTLFGTGSPPIADNCDTPPTATPTASSTAPTATQTFTPSSTLTAFPSHTPGPGSSTPIVIATPSATLTPPPSSTLAPFPTALPTRTLVPGPTHVMSATPDLTATPGGPTTPSDDNHGGDILNSIGDFFNWIFNQFGAFFDFIGSAFNWLSATVGNLVTIISNLLAGIIAFVQFILNTLQQLLAIIGLVLAIINHLIALLSAWLTQLVNTIRFLIQAYYGAFPLPIPALPQCTTAPSSSGVCAFYYVIQNTLLAGPVGSVIIPVIVVLVDLKLIFYFVVTARNLIVKAEGVLGGD